MKPSPKALAVFISATFSHLAIGQSAADYAAEKSRSWASEAVRASAAHAKGATGKGIVIGVIDSGFNAHQELTGRVLTGYDVYTGTSNVSDQMGHGTAVASAAASAKDGKGFFGVAPEAKILPVKVFQTGSASGSVISAGIRYTIGKAKIVNLSLAGTAPFGTSAMRDAVNSGQLLVAAAGNSAGANPLWPARFAKETWAKGQIIAAGAVDQYNNIASFSNRAGDTMYWYLVAPGRSVPLASASNPTGYTSGSGTSFATPIIAGTAANVWGYWPYLKANQVADILFKTATDLGTTGIDAIYGRGLVSLEKALQPVGAMSVPTASSTKPIAGTAMTTSVAMHSTLKKAAAKGQFTVAAVDEYGRDFQTDLGASFSPARGLTSVQIFGTTDRRMAFIDRLLDPLGSRLIVAVDASRPELSLGSFATYENRFFADQALSAMSLVQKFSNGSELSLGTGGLQSFFGLAAVEFEDAPGLTMPAVSNQYFALVPSANSLGFGRELGNGVKVKAGVLTSELSDLTLQQYGRQTVNSANLMLAEISKRWRDLTIGMQFGQLSESGALLGTAGASALAIDGAAPTMVTTLNFAYRLAPSLAVGGYYSLGNTGAFSNTADSVLTGNSAVRSSAFGMAAIRANAWTQGDALSVSVSQPLRAETGTMNLNASTGTTEDGTMLYETRAVALAASSRETLTELSYTRPLTGNDSLGMSFIYRLNPDHDPDAPTERVLALRYQLQF